MRTNIVYIPGLFETNDSALAKSLKNHFESVGYDFYITELYQESHFGSYSEQQEIERIEEFILKHHPSLLIAHSLGAYLTMQIKTDIQIVLLDPSFSIKNIVHNNLRNSDGYTFYDDGEQSIKLSERFIASLETSPTIEGLAEYVSNKKILIFGAGKGGYKVAEKYHSSIPQAEYILMPEATHNFSSSEDIKNITAYIKKWLRINRNHT